MPVDQSVEEVRIQGPLPRFPHAARRAAASKRRRREDEERAAAGRADQHQRRERREDEERAAAGRADQHQRRERRRDEREDARAEVPGVCFEDVEGGEVAEERKGAGVEEDVAVGRSRMRIGWVAKRDHPSLGPRRGPGRGTSASEKKDGALERGAVHRPTRICKELQQFNTLQFIQDQDQTLVTVDGSIEVQLADELRDTR
ncbi:hypothetical protein C8J57DRAFT_1217785 [Mycena rebaudengoi]|nr:hypothetical protein C8J57DRAFT_1217785 [Mycena rebaudengoi]